MKIFAGHFEKSHTGAEIEVIPSLGSSGGVKALLNGFLDIAVSDDGCGMDKEVLDG